MKNRVMGNIIGHLQMNEKFILNALWHFSLANAR